jgi:signal transduction histidine kinase
MSVLQRAVGASLAQRPFAERLPRRRRKTAWVASVMCPLLLTLGQRALGSSVPPATTLFVTLLVVVVVALLGGLGPALAAIVTGLIAQEVLFEFPYGSLNDHRPAQISILVVFVVIGAGIGIVVDELARLHKEQAALRRLGTLVARGVPPAELFSAVADEVASLLDVDSALVAHLDPDGVLTILAAGSAQPDEFVARERMNVEPPMAVAEVLRTGRPARADDYHRASPGLRERIERMGIRSTVATPIAVNGHLWGAVVASSWRGPLPADTEQRMLDFTELVATAIANAESRAELARLAEEQAVLRRVATLVARGVPPVQVFAAVTEEVERLLPIDFAALERYELDDTCAVLASAGSAAGSFAAGSRQSLGGRNLATRVFETARPARMDNYADSSSGPLGADVRKAGICSAVGAPIMVEGHLWGLIVVGSTVTPSLPGDIEGRLGSFTEIVATAIANADSRDQLTASRARLVTEAHEARRRVVRDLHDGGQRLLVHTIIKLKLARRALEGGQPDLAPLLSEALEHAERANDELRELSHGQLPSVLTREGLRAGVDELVATASIPVEVDVRVGRLPAVVEATAYFLVAEAVTNLVKHARAERAQVRAFVQDDTLHVEVRDDGVGGANPRGEGLVGLSDRVTALQGRLSIQSPAQGGTILAATLPLDSK